VLFGYGKDIIAPDVILYVLDATNLERNLYLLTQIIEAGRPVVVALTMVDLARKQGIVIDTEALEQRLGVPVVPVQATRRLGLSALQQALRKAVRLGSCLRPLIQFPEAFSCEVDTLTLALPRTNKALALPRFLIERLLLDANGSIEKELVLQFGEGVSREARTARERLAAASIQVPQVESDIRYRWIAETVEATVRHPLTASHTWTDRIDWIVTH